ncbi:hypothetical protein ACTXT7_015126 [Hymenolepis weldensis]
MSEKLKSMLQSDLLIIHYKPDIPIVITTDASDYCIQKGISTFSANHFQRWMEIKHASAKDSVIRKAMKFAKTKSPSSSFKGNLLVLFHRRNALSIVDFCLMFNESVVISAALNQRILRQL